MGPPVRVRNSLSANLMSYGDLLKQEIQSSSLRVSLHLLVPNLILFFSRSNHFARSQKSSFGRRLMAILIS
jgi:hypothetical protein